MKPVRILTASVVALLATACVTRPGDGREPRRQSLFGALGFVQDSGSENNETTPLRGRAARGELPLPQVGAHTPSRNSMSLPNILTRELTKVDGNVWRSSVDAVQLFNMLSRLLSQNYLLTSVDRKSLTLSTDWDKFFIEGRLFRNRLSISVFPVGHRQTEVVLKNSVEYFSGNPNNPQEMTLANWLPSPDITDEVSRVVDSLNKQIAFYQNQIGNYR